MMRSGDLRRLAGLLLAVCILLAGCAAPSTPPAASATPSATYTQPSPSATLPAEPTLPPETTPTSIPPASVWVAPSVPAALRESLQLAPGVELAEQQDEAAYWLGAGSSEVLSRWVYALVAPFPTVLDGVSATELRAAWAGDGSGPFAGKPLLMDAPTRETFSAAWGGPAAGAVKVVPADGLLEQAWKDQPAWAIVPFEALEPRWKVLAVEGVSPLHKDFDPAAYPLAVPFALQPNPAGGIRPGSLVQSLLPTNRDPAKMTEVITTGVTALVRATAETMRRKGNTYPAQDIGAILQAADITHVSNEIPFSPDCPLPDAWQKELVFCSQPAYIELLEAIGADVVELTGDHFGDWGPEAMNYTLDLYRQKDIAYYGGGYNFEDARKPLLIEHNGNRIAFIGCNAKGRGYATAREDNPGAIFCDLDWLSGEVARLRADGYLPIVTFQHIEYYTYVPQPKLIEDFHRVAAGAAIVQGSQAHQPHGMEFYNGALIHYGLGNLFFDQYHMGLPTGQGFLDRHVFYDGRHLSTELIGIRFVDFARPRLMTPEERQELLESVFAASLW